jgi:hypothetical protein
MDHKGRTVPSGWSSIAVAPSGMGTSIHAAPGHWMESRSGRGADPHVNTCTGLFWDQ